MSQQTEVDIPRIDARAPEAIGRAAEVIRSGGLVVVPTESSYALAVDPTNARAVARLLEAKRRESKPVGLIASSMEVVAQHIHLTDMLTRVAGHFWPGPLTIAGVPKMPLPDGLLGGVSTLAIRISDHPVAKPIAAAAGGVITSTSANSRGLPPACEFNQFEPGLLAACDLFVDSGQTVGGEPSTVIGEVDDELVVFRSGAIGVACLAELLGFEPRVLG